MLELKNIEFIPFLYILAKDFITASKNDNYYVNKTVNLIYTPLKYLQHDELITIN